MASNQNRGRNLRIILHSAYSFVRSHEVNQALGMLTLDHLITAQQDAMAPGKERPIYNAAGSTGLTRISRWNKLDQLEADVKAVVAEVNKAGSDARKLADMGIYEAIDPSYQESP